MKKMTNLLANCEVHKNIMLRTAKDYTINGTLVLQHVTSSGNIWIDESFKESLSDKEYEELNIEIRNFFSNVKEIYHMPIVKKEYKSLKYPMSLYKTILHESEINKTI